MTLLVRYRPLPAWGVWYATVYTTGPAGAPARSLHATLLCLSRAECRTRALAYIREHCAGPLPRGGQAGTLEVPAGCLWEAVARPANAQQTKE